MDTTVRKRKAESGQAITEFAIAIPIFMAAVIFIIGASWIVFTQLTADYSAFAGARAGTINRGEVALPWLAPGVFDQKVSVVAGPRTKQAIGAPSLSVDAARFLRLQDTTHFDLGLFGHLQLGAGAAPRLQQFFPGPPDPWE